MDNISAKYQAVVNAPFGSVGIALEEGHLSKIDLLATPLRSVLSEDAKVKPIVRKIRAYLQDPCSVLDIPVRTEGTEFQRRVWKRLREIPIGEVRSYGELARELNTSARAVGNACRKNPCPLVIPCHRVVGKAGLGGFSGQTAGAKLDIKRWLLIHEGWLTGQ